MNSQELRKFREKRGLTQGEFAKALGVAQQSISQWERGEHRIPQSIIVLLKYMTGRLRKRV